MKNHNGPELAKFYEGRAKFHGRMAKMWLVLCIASAIFTIWWSMQIFKPTPKTGILYNDAVWDAAFEKCYPDGRDGRYVCGDVILRAGDDPGPGASGELRILKRGTKEYEDYKKAGGTL